MRKGIRSTKRRTIKKKHSSKKYTKRKHTKRKHIKRTKHYRMKGGNCPPFDPAQATDKTYMQQHPVCQLSQLMGRAAP